MINKHTVQQCNGSMYCMDQFISLHSSRRSEEENGDTTYVCWWNNLLTQCQDLLGESGPCRGAGRTGVAVWSLLTACELEVFHTR